MVWRHRTAAALVLGLVLVVAVVLLRGARVAVQSPPEIVLDGQPLSAGARDVSPRPGLAILLPPGSQPGDFAAALDGRAVLILATQGRSARLVVGDLAQGSRHHLEVWRGAIGAAHVGSAAVDFQVAAPLRLAASWLAGPSQTTVQVSASRELVDVQSLQAALVNAGASVRRDERGVEGRWPAGRTAAFTVPAGTRATNGAYLPADFSPSMPANPAAPTSRVDLSDPPAPRPSGLRLRTYYVPGPAARASLARNALRIQVLSPSFYAVDGSGSLVSAVDGQAMGLARAAHLAVEPLVTNQDFSAAGARGAFKAGVDRVATSLVAEARRQGYTGYQLDFEGLGFGDRADLTEYSVALGRRLASAGLQYSTAVIPTKNAGGGGLAQLFGHSGVYDYGQLARGAASMSVMAYDQHTSATDPGPVAAADWARQVSEASTAGLDRSRIDLGIPLYNRDWPLHGAATAGSYSDLVTTAFRADGTVTWDFAAMSPLVRYSLAGEEHVAWMENQLSLLVKLHVAHDLGFEGVAAWRLGLEDPGFWDLW